VGGGEEGALDSAVEALEQAQPKLASKRTAMAKRLVMAMLEMQDLGQ
jgi:hypothetical protein